MLVANARMYCVEPASAAAWRVLLDWVAARASVPMQWFEHQGPLDALWRRPDLGCAFMCGYPWAAWQASSGARPMPLATPCPVSSDAMPRYRTCIVVRDASALAGLEDVRGRRFAYTTPSSQSGYQAARCLFAGASRAHGGRYFERVVGPLVTPRRVVEALTSGEADAGPLDSYWLDLLARREPDTARRLRVIATTPWTPMPLLAASARVPDDARERLTRALLEAADEPALREARDTLALAGFAKAEQGTYAVLAESARQADALGYPNLQ
jgi:ABC-type phosphate/phosphonate transport system substrate-binding protein